MNDTSKAVLLEDGSTVRPVATLMSGKVRTHIVVEEGCYAVFMENPAGKASRTPWITQSAWSVLKTLQPPSKGKVVESKLDSAVRALQLAEPATVEAEGAAKEVLEALPKAAVAELKNLVEHGPVYDGDLLSKSGRDALRSANLCSYAVHNGEEGYQTATRIGFQVYKAAAST